MKIEHEPIIIFSTSANSVNGEEREEAERKEKRKVREREIERETKEDQEVEGDEKTALSVKPSSLSTPRVRGM